MICARCNDRVTDGANFCPSCGASVFEVQGDEHTAQCGKHAQTILNVLLLVGILLMLAYWYFFGNKHEERVVPIVHTDVGTQSIETTSVARTSSWEEFRSPTGTFSVLFPRYPSHSSEVVKLPDTQLAVMYDSYVSTDTNGTAYLINVSEYPPEVDISNPTANLEGALNGMVAANEGGQLLSSNMTVYKEYPAIDYLVQAGDVGLKGRIVLVGHKMYQLMVSYHEATHDAQAYSTFIESFEAQ
jgi:hypothetical protein